MLVSVLVATAAVLTSSASFEERIEQASVTLLPGICSGVIAGDRQHVVTAAHCLGARTDSIPIGFKNGKAGIATAEAVMTDDDVAVLRLDEPAPFEPLEILSGLPAPGTEVYFRGRIDQPEDHLQAAVVQRLGPCPSLPHVPAALHTTIRGAPGDSGSPLVDRQLRVVGLVHGGAMCSIAAPAAPAAPVLATLAREGAQCVAPSAPRREEQGVGGSGSAH